jgi:hypothetical protein
MEILNSEKSVRAGEGCASQRISMIETSSINPTETQKINRAVV